MKTPLATLLMLFILNSCNRTNTAANHLQVASSNEELETRKREFPKFLSKFRMLPKKEFELSPTGIDTSLATLDDDSSDTLFINYNNGAPIYGMLADTSKFYALLWYAMVENGALTLTVIDKAGNKLDEKQLFTGLYGWDCGYNWYGRIFVKKDMSIVLRDSIIIFECDSGIPPESTWKRELDSVDVTIIPNGKLQFSKVRQTKLN